MDGKYLYNIQNKQKIINQYILRKQTQAKLILYNKMQDFHKLTEINRQKELIINSPIITQPVQDNNVDEFNVDEINVDEIILDIMPYILKTPKKPTSSILPSSVKKVSSTKTLVNLSNLLNNMPKNINKISVIISNTDNDNTKEFPILKNDVILVLYSKPTNPLLEHYL